MKDLKEKDDILSKMEEYYGTNDSNSVYILGAQVVGSLGGKKKVGKATHSAILDMLKSMAPRNTHEGMLAVQLISTHFLAMDVIAGMRKSDIKEMIEFHAKLTDKLMKLFLKQTEALRKLQNGNQQRIIIEKVEVQSGGQAVVGNIQSGG